MYKTGDINQNFERLRVELKKIKYPAENFESENIQNGNPLYFLPIIHYVVLDYSKHIAKLLIDNEYELFSKSDQEFVSKAFKALIELFNFKPNVTIKQFFAFGYAEAKVILCLEIIRIIKAEHNNIVKKVYAAKPPVGKSKKANDSFRSVRGNGDGDNFIEYMSNNTERKIIKRDADNLNNSNKNRKDEKYNLNDKLLNKDLDENFYRKDNYENKNRNHNTSDYIGNKTTNKNEDLYINRLNKLYEHDDLEEDFPNIISPKFNETPVKRNYNFDTRFLKKDKTTNSNKISECENNEHINDKNLDDIRESDIPSEVFLNHDEDQNKNSNLKKNYNSEKKLNNLANKEIRKNKIQSGNNLYEYNYLSNDKQKESDLIENNFIYDCNQNNKIISNNINTIPKNYNNHSNRYKESDHTEKNELDDGVNPIEDRENHIISYNEHSRKQDKISFRAEENSSNNEKCNTDKYDEKIQIPKINGLNKNQHTNIPNPETYSQNKNSFIEFSSLIEVINTLANSVKDMTAKVDEFKTNMENRVEKIEAELILIKNRMSLLENKSTATKINNLNNTQIISQASQNNNNYPVQLQVQESIINNLNNTNEDNEHIFSFADDHNIHFQKNLVSKLDITTEEKNLRKNHSLKNKLVKNNINNNFEHKPIIKDNIQNNKQQNKILNDIEDTDSIIQRIADRFKETQKLLNEFK